MVRGKAFKEEVGFEENFDSEDHLDGNSIICSRGMPKKKKNLKGKTVWTYMCMHVCVYIVMEKVGVQR